MHKYTIILFIIQRNFITVHGDLFLSKEKRPEESNKAAKNKIAVNDEF